MAFNPHAYSPEVAALLALHGNGERLMPLAGGECSSREILRRLQLACPETLFPRARSADAAMAGLYLYFSCLDECHSLAQGLETREGAYWHGIMHRQEPDPANSAYWFRKVGAHPIYPALNAAAESRGYPVKQQWDPFQFIDYCERARRAPGSDEERIALEVQRSEWQLLFDYCAVESNLEASQ